MSFKGQRMSFPLEVADPSSLGFDAGQLLKLEQMILKHLT